MRIYWNRFSTRFYFRNEFKYNYKKIKDPYVFYKMYAKQELKKKYTNYDDMYNYLNIKLNKIKEHSPNLKPIIVKLIEDNDYNFITQKNYKLYLIRSDNRITSHLNTEYFNKYCIDFYEPSMKCICHKGLIYALM